ncbi:DUF3592 domain-containing protein [Cellvibrio sp. NN19]|uniref:DUF3592 domain-containing protein n=1 Tax=Cellvibrio chitinivorans TaxID=3102792 RepID=UPI002B417156|nr:DUF3592 domain-containing protein [Cellvibrio sp. NN19]
MNPENEKKYQRLRSLFFGLCIIAAALLFLSSTSNIYKSKAAEQWTVYEGEVTRELSRGLNYFGGTWLEYSYEVNGNKYQGTEIGYGISRPQTQLKKGQIVRVYVDPVDANKAVLEVGVARNHFIGLVFSIGFIWVAFVIWRRTA